MAITIGIKNLFVWISTLKQIMILLDEAGVEIVHLEKAKIVKWAKELVGKYEKMSD